VDFVRTWSEKTGLAIERLLQWLGLSGGKYYDWRRRYGKTNQHNGWVPLSAQTAVGNGPASKCISR
jgi:hypothetical protein